MLTYSDCVNRSALRQSDTDLVVVPGKGRVYQIAPAYRSKDGQQFLDFGHVVLRFGVPAAGA